MRYVAWIWHNTRGIRLNTIVRILAGCGRVGCGLLMVWLSKLFIDETIHTGSHQQLVLMISLLVGTVVGRISLVQAYYYLTITASTRQTNDIRRRIFALLFRRQMFSEQMMHSGDVTSRLEQDVSIVSEATTSLLPEITVTAVQLGGAFLLMLSMDARLAWILLLTTPVIIVAGKLFARTLRQLTLSVREQDSRIQMLIQEGTEHQQTLRSLESGPWVMDRLDQLQETLTDKINRRTRFTLVSRWLMAACFGLGYLLAFVWGGLQLRAGVITFGVMTSFLQLVGQIQTPIYNLLNLMPKFIHATASIDRLEELERQPMEPHQPSTVMEGPTGVRLTHVSYGYATSQSRTLHDMTYDFRPGSKTAVTGHTGAGKTTLFRLLLALIQPEEGEAVVYDGKRQARIGIGTRGNFVFVPQGNTLLSGSVRQNLLIAKPEASDEELRQVLSRAKADFVFSLPGGMDTELGERGIGLSEGQAQRIAIARGLLRPGQVLLLDEISSALDEDTEKALFKGLFAAYPDKTIIVITHRPSVSQMCDNTLQLKPSV